MEEKVVCTAQVAILLATYNGENYIREQLDSLLSQTFQDFVVYIHDDGSDDKTKHILKEYAASSDKIVVLEYESNHGAKENFFSLLDHVEANYYMFCDQDDIWHNDKIEKSYSTIKNLESKYGKDKALCIYTDLRVVDENKNVINDSFFKMEGIFPEFLKDFNHVAASNFATGCTMLFNHKAKESMNPDKEFATMHDAWFALSVMVSDGIVFPIRETLIDYRQHADNTLGAVDANRLSLSYRIKHAKSLLKQLWRHYKMHQSLGYGNIFKFIYYKIVYKVNIKNNKCK